MIPKNKFLKLKLANQKGRARVMPFMAINKNPNIFD
jgi:hypothetical protein